jgi:2-C-methyl-D-erythritol 2,4-cyclodiphosphate synthase
MTRVGLGYDIHALKQGRRLVLGGVEIASALGLDGHSDADVVVHALIDALLGAAGLGDLGRHFPPSDEAYRGVSSMDLLQQAVVLIHVAGYRVGNVDVTVVAERPRLAPHVQEMRTGLARVLGVPVQDVSVKATTNEGLGPEGRGEGMSAQAIAALEQLP